MRKGIILAGGQGTRLRPATLATSKHLLPIYDKPMIFYSISALMLSGINEILLISDPVSLPSYKLLFGDGTRFGLKMTYAEQKKPNGLPEAFLIGEEFIEKKDCCLVLGDNFFHGQGLSEIFLRASNQIGCSLILRPVPNPHDFGVCILNETGEFLKIVEKPETFVSNWIATGMYYFDGSAPDVARSLKPSSRGELEISDMINEYSSISPINIEKLGRGCAWLDTGSFEGLFNATSYVRSMQQQHGYMIACLEEIAIKLDWLSLEEAKKGASHYKGEYRSYLERFIKNEVEK
tara:strand:- start:2900 stop:3775 length:876 start_codon:yes stop_codon:yes gene_type:complete